MSKKTAKPKPSEASATYQAKDVVLAKLRGFPPWPAQVIEDEHIPSHIAKERPASKANKFYCVRFFPVGDFCWLVSKDLSLLQKHEIEAYINEPHKKSPDLLQGYKAALDPEKWQEEKEAEQVQIDRELAEAEVDELEEEGDGKSEKKSKKRKRETDAKPKAKANGATGEKKKRAKKGEGKSAEGVESEDEATTTKAPATKRTKKGANAKDDAESPEVKKVKEWRHRIQKHFLTGKTNAADEMPEYDKLFTDIENFEELGVEHLTHSKIGKVMRHIAALKPEQVARDDEFKFRERANKLVDKWHKIIGESGEGGADSTAPNGTA